MGYDADDVMQLLPWARRFARACASKLPGHLDRDDLQSAGVLGFLKAADRYDRSKGASFRGFCAVRIRGAVLDELRKWEWAPRSVYKNSRRITRVTAMLTEKLNREPTGPELAAELDIPASDLPTHLSFSQPRQLVSFEDANESGQADEGLSLMERLADPNATKPDAGVHGEEDRATLLRCLSLLPKSQVTVIVLHYLQDVPLHEVADLLHVTPSRVSQLHHQALARLRQLWKHGESATG